MSLLPFPRMWVEKPCGWVDVDALTCIEMNRSALFLLAMSARLFRVTKTSVVLVYITLTSG